MLLLHSLQNTSNSNLTYSNCFNSKFVMSNQIQSITVANFANSKFYCCKLGKFKVSLFQIFQIQSFIVSNCLISKFHWFKLQNVKASLCQIPWHFHSSWWGCSKFQLNSQNPKYSKFRGIFTRYGEAAPNSNQTVKI